jgi:hypothetical protein
LQEIWDLSSAPSSSTSPNTHQNYVPYVYYLVYDIFSPISSFFSSHKKREDADSDNNLVRVFSFT